MEPVEIREDGLLLRPWRPADADAVHRACQDPDIQRWTSVPVPYLPQHAAGFVGEMSPAAWARGTGALFGVFDASTGELLGSCGLIAIDHRVRSGEIGYWTAAWARGRAVASRASRALARWAFDGLKLRRVVWQAAVGNQASRLAALRAGFRVEGRIRRAAPHRAGDEAWIGSLLPADLAGDPPAVPELTRRRAAVFGAGPPVLAAKAGTDEIRLRPPAERDVAAIVASCRDPGSVRWTTVPDPYARSDAEYFVRRHAPGRWAEGSGAVFVIADPADAHAGAMELRISPADPLVADVGFLVAPAARGRGYAPAALRALAGWGCGALGLARVEWRAHVGNTASRRVAEKAGFTVEGIARGGIAHRGERRDAWVAALLAGDVA